MTNEKKENIIPEAKGLFYALRSSGYSNDAAIADLVDNSLDAGAQNVHIYIDNNMSTIYISDDGCGMPMEVLQQAIRLGGKKVHDSAGDLGKYGLGLITASLSLGRKIRVITKNNDEYNTAVFDYDSIMKNNSFTAVFRESTEGEISSFDYRTEDAKSGTVLVIEGVDKIQFNSLTDLTDSLEKSIKQTFSAFMRDGRNIYIGDALITPEDPLFLKYEDTRRLVDKDVVVESSAGEPIGKMHILAVALPVYEPKVAKSMHINMQNQGFYIMRNNRLIASAVVFPEIFKRHNNYNYFRVEVNFSPELDDKFGLNFSKHNVTPSKEIINILKSELSGATAQIVKEAKERQEESKRKRQEKNPFVSGGASEQSDEPAGTRIEKQKNLEAEYTVRVQKEDDPLFSIAIDNEKMKVRYNGKNKYYNSRVVQSEYGSEVKKELDKFLTATMKSCLANNMTTKQISDIMSGIAKEMEA